MKKIITILLAAILVLACTVSVGAAGAINAEEQKVLDALSQKVEFNGVVYFIPDEYINQARNYFLTTDCDITAAEAEEIMKYIDNGIDIVTHAEEAVHGTVFNLEDLSNEHKAALLDQGEAACDVVDLTFTYDTTEGKVVITDDSNNNETLFIEEAIIKTTGATADYTAIVITVCALATVMVAAYAISKKAKMF